MEIVGNFITWQHENISLSFWISQRRRKNGEIEFERQRKSREREIEYKWQQNKIFSIDLFDASHT